MRGRTSTEAARPGTARRSRDRLVAAVAVVALGALGACSSGGTSDASYGQEVAQVPRLVEFAKARHLLESVGRIGDPVEVLGVLELFEWVASVAGVFGPLAEDVELRRPSGVRSRMASTGRREERRRQPRCGR